VPAVFGEGALSSAARHFLDNRLHHRRGVVLLGPLFQPDGATPVGHQGEAQVGLIFGDKPLDQGTSLSQVIPLERVLDIVPNSPCLSVLADHVVGQLLSYGGHRDDGQA